MTHATAGVGHVAGAARNHMNVEMVDGLAGRYALVEADVEPIRRLALVQQGLGLLDGADQGGLFAGVQLGPDGDVAMGR